MKKLIIAILMILTSLILLGAAVAADITARPGQADPYKTRSELLMQATEFTGVSTPEEAASVWAEGLRMRSAALQYTVMTKPLKEKYAKELDGLRSNWVTGMSSPWVSGFEIKQVDRADQSHAVVSLIFETLSSGSKPEYYGARLWLVRQGAFWRIEKISADEGLYYYTLYR